MTPLGPCPVCHREIDPNPQPRPRTPIGRVAKLVDLLAEDISASFGGPPLAKRRRERLHRHRVSRLYKHADGGCFDVSIVDAEGQPTGVIARVTIAYSRFDEVEANGSRGAR